MIRLKFLMLLSALALVSGVSAQAEARLVGSYTWNSFDGRVGGISALEIAPDGLDFTAMNDRATLFEGRLIRGGAGEVVGVRAAIRPMMRPNGRRADSGGADTEGLAIAPDGTLYASLEGPARVWRVTPGETVPRPLRIPGEFRALPRNGALEAMAIAPDNSLFVIPESPVRDGTFAIYRYQGGTWTTAFKMTATEGFAPVGADFGPDGRLYILERNFSMLGFRSQVRRITLAPLGSELILQTARGVHDNLEGIAVWQDAGGAIRLTMVSDDNFFAIQKTEFVDYRLD
ncbi:esterase-like activity of phytase family protein [Roseisalinus antarcticus]|uniref:Phytase-like domain-containing protein n=1 Tax=Roseisalinus antarcticus TaxID=254357 RepID=A0A1Y5TX55_9RHOB|nr:esterase-like activity of phytase family protein [Roseisalinus antarcticus]SLN75931.1 hypothetical protein ROA7023_04061 [Roseisalinus antarcticus]